MVFNRIQNTPLPQPHTVCIYSTLTQESLEGGEFKQFTKLCLKYLHDWLYLQPINSDKHLPQSPFAGYFF